MSGTPAIALQRPPSTPTANSGKPAVRKRNASGTQESILRAATKVFAKQGYDGASVQAISKSAKSVDRMIYYYFGNKEGLFIAVLESMYVRFNEAEAQLRLDPEDDVGSLTEIIRFMARYYQKNPDFVALLNAENLHRGKHISKLPNARRYSSPAVAVLEDVLKRGMARSRFRPGLQARDVYLMIASMGYFYVSNRFTLAAFLGEVIDEPAAYARWHDFVVESILRAVRVD